MKQTYRNANTGGELYLVDREEGFDRFFYSRDGNNRMYTISWNTGPAQEVKIDNIIYHLPANTILPLMIRQTFTFQRPDDIVAWQFNRDFYCIVNHDSEVGCAGFLFYGASGNLFISPDEQDLRKIALLLEMFREEFGNADKIQEEMLRILLVRLIINVTRVGRQQYLGDREIDESTFDIVRKFNLLVEMHFREQHDVKFYADLLHKSPKTISNYFARYESHSPLQVIHERLAQEAKRLFLFTNKSAKEVSAELGFEDDSHFSRFFKNQLGMSVTEFKKGKVAK